MTAYSVRNADYGEDWHEVDAWDAEDAAQDYCEERYSDWEYPQGPLDIEVKDEDGIIVLMRVSVEMVPSFHASDVEYEPRRACTHTRKPEWCITSTGLCSGCGGTFPELVKKP